MSVGGRGDDGDRTTELPSAADDDTALTGGSGSGASGDVLTYNFTDETSKFHWSKLVVLFTFCVVTCFLCVKLCASS